MEKTKMNKIIKIQETINNIISGYDITKSNEFVAMQNIIFVAQQKLKESPLYREVE